MARILLTCTDVIAQRIISATNASGHTILHHPMLKIEPLEVDPSIIASTPKALLITSHYALKAAEHWKKLPLYVIGSQLAQQAQTIGFNVVNVGQSISDLIPHLPPRTLYLRGEHISQPIETQQIICYRAHLLPLNESKIFDAITLFSARVANSLPFIDASILCMSQRVANAAPQNLKSKIVIAKQPTHQSMIDLINRWQAN